MAIRTWVVVGVAVLGLAAPGALGAATAPRARAVVIKQFKYTPPALSVPVGTKVTWTNRDEETHTITSAKGAFSSTGLGNEETFTQTFTQPGTYEIGRASCRERV